MGKTIKTAAEVVAAIARVADARVDGDRVIIVGLAPDADGYGGETGPGSAWDDECVRLMRQVRQALPAGWLAEWSDDDVLIERH